MSGLRQPAEGFCIACWDLACQAPRADNILEIIKILQVNERVKLRVEARKAA